MYARKVKRKCGVRGCKNTDSYSLSLTRESGNSVIICKECLKAALSAAENHTEDNRKIVSREIPPLFFNAFENKNNSENKAPKEENSNTSAVKKKTAKADKPLSK